MKAIKSHKRDSGFRSKYGAQFKNRAERKYVRSKLSIYSNTLDELILPLNHKHSALHNWL